LHSILNARKSKIDNKPIQIDKIDILSPIESNLCDEFVGDISRHGRKIDDQPSKVTIDERSGKIDNGTTKISIDENGRPSRIHLTGTMSYFVQKMENGKTKTEIVIDILPEKSMFDKVVVVEPALTTKFSMSHEKIRVGLLRRDPSMIREDFDPNPIVVTAFQENRFAY